MKSTPVVPIDAIQGPTPQAHSHRWRIDEQAGARSEGRCSCGQAKAFLNGWDGDGFQLNSGSWRNRGVHTVAEAK